MTKTDADQQADVEIVSVDSLQGRQKDVIIFSCVRNNSRASVELPESRVLNTVITRAKKGLIAVVGSSSICSRQEPNNLFVFRAIPVRSQETRVGSLGSNGSPLITL